MTYYKCLHPHGVARFSGFHWSLPRTDNGVDWEPGEWHEVPSALALAICRVGLHVTDQPALWTWAGKKVWECEVDGDRVGNLDECPRKVAFRRARLLRPLAEWEVRAVRDRWLANLSRANLRGADLRRADLSEADLSEADLSGADLSGADLFEANLSKANLSKANLFGANLFGANLHGAYLSGADPERTIR